MGSSELFILLKEIPWLMSVKKTVNLLTSGKGYLLKDDYLCAREDLFANSIQLLYNLHVSVPNKTMTTQDLLTYALLKEKIIQSYNFKIKNKKFQNKINKIAKKEKIILQCLNTHRELINIAQIFQNCLHDYGYRCKKNNEHIILWKEEETVVAIIHVVNKKVKEIKNEDNEKILNSKYKYIKETIEKGL